MFATLDIIIGFIAGAFVVGFIANRRPQWFASAVALANAASDKVTTAVKNKLGGI